MRDCLFCDSPADTKEDGWPLWLLKRFEVSSKSEVEARVGNDAPRTYRSTRPLAVTCVCAKCNNGWMSDIENKAKVLLEPMFRGARVGLDHAACATLSVWGLKTAMVLERIETDGVVQYTRDECARLRQFSIVPARSRIWLAASLDDTQLYSAKTHHLDAELDRSASSHVSTLAFGTVVMQIYTLRLGSTPSPDVRVTTDVRRGPWEEATSQLWPVTTSVATWPPRVALNGVEGLDALAERFSTSRVAPPDLIPLAI